MTPQDKGLLLGGGVAFLSTALIALPLSGALDIPGQRGGWFFEYQTLIAGLFALAGAGITVFFLRKQITQAAADAERSRRAVIAGQNQSIINQLLPLHDLLIRTGDVLSSPKDGVRIEFVESARGARLGPQLGMLHALAQAWSEWNIAVTNYPLGWRPSVLSKCVETSEVASELIADLVYLLSDGMTLHELWHQSREWIRDEAEGRALETALRQP